MNYSIFDPFQDGVIVLDEKGNVVYCNDAATLMGGSASNRFRKGASLNNLLQSIKTESTESLEGPSPYKEMTYTFDNGSTVKIQISIQKEPNLSDTPTPKKKDRWIVYLRDVTLEESLHLKYKTELEKKENLIRELKDAQEQLIQFSKAAVLGQFIASITHELNNPLTYLTHSAEELKKLTGQEPLNLELIKKHVGYMEKGASKIAQLSSHLKTFLHSPLGTKDHIYSSISPVIERAMSFTEHFTSKNGISVVNLLPKDLPKTFLDPTLLEQIAINLIRNSTDAMTESGNTEQLLIEINGTYDERSNSLIISFKDTGPGIPPEVMKKLFTPFYTTKPIGKGTGLGLNICSNIAGRHGGTLTVRSKPGEGATFYLTLPVKDTNEQTDETDMTNMLKGLKILIVDDEPWIRSIIKLNLTQNNSEVVEANNGKEALEYCKNNRPDIVITDFTMPGMTGIELAQNIRKMYNTHTKIILLTGTLTTQSLAPHLQLFDEFILKPFPNELVKKVIAKVISHSAQQG